MSLFLKELSVTPCPKGTVIRVDDFFETRIKGYAPNMLWGVVLAMSNWLDNPDLMAGDLSELLSLDRETKREMRGKGKHKQPVLVLSIHTICRIAPAAK
ncbi:MAG: hypothetical protein WCV68_00335 [Candidatus Paceibacterota bacterium]|jgi:hypothetical protein